MPIADLYFKRKKRLNGDIPEIYKYDIVPSALRVQIIHIADDTIRGEHIHYPNIDYTEDIYEKIHKILAREYGKFRFGNAYDSYEKTIQDLLLSTQDTDQTLTIIELLFRYITIELPQLPGYMNGAIKPKMKPAEAVEELNERFKEQGIGYQFENGYIIRMDSTFAHSEIIKPALSLLLNKKFKGANEEYLKAHEYYRSGDNKQAIVECLNAFESVLKTICQEKKWNFSKSDNAKDLIKVCFKNGLLPPFMQNQFTYLEKLLSTGVPPLRNNLGGHGQGQVPIAVGNEIAQYALNLTASNILFLVKQSVVK